MKSRSSSLRRARPLLGTLVDVRAWGAPPEVLEAGAAAAFAAVSQVQALMSFHASDSELSRLNRGAARAAVEVHEWTWRVLRKAKELWEVTGGLFDCSVAPILAAAGFLPNAALHAANHRSSSMGEVEFQRGRRVRFARPLLLDLGGIAKGFAVDRAVEALRAAGVRRGAVNAGGDLRVFGEEPEPVHVRSPRRPGELIFLGIFAELAVATSAAYFCSRVAAGTRLVPIVDPRRARCIADDRSATVAAPECMLADALTKPLLLDGHAGASFLPRYAAHAVVLA